MSGTLQTAPSTTLSDNNQWEYELNLTELAKRGYEGVSLTEWAAGNTTRPEVAAGSVIEIDGSTFKYTTDNAISDEAGLTDGWCYLKHVVSGIPQITTPTLTNTFGTWDTAKQGFYDGSGNRYSLFAMYRSGAITKIFTEKDEIDYKTAKLGYRFYDKFYTGTFAYDAGVYIFSFTETVFNFAEYYGHLGTMIFISATYASDVNDIGFSTTENVGGKLKFKRIISSAYDGKTAKVGIKYKLTL